MTEKQLKILISLLIVILFSTYIAISILLYRITLDSEENQQNPEKREITLKN